MDGTNNIIIIIIAAETIVCLDGGYTVLFHIRMTIHCLPLAVVNCTSVPDGLFSFATYIIVVLALSGRGLNTEMENIIISACSLVGRGPFSPGRRRIARNT